MKTCIVLPVTEDSQVGEARRFVATLSRALEFNDNDRGKVAIIVTEVANNLLKHAQKGQLILQSLVTSEAVGIEIIAIDSGPGIRDVNQCLQDGFSTGGTAGNGLGAIQRLSAFFEIYSQPQVGTVLVSRFWAQKPTHPKPPILTTLRSTPRSHQLELGAINLPKLSGDVSGDAWAVENHLDRCLVLVADGLGSGALAAEASQEAVRVFQANVAQHPQAILEQIHAALRKTRGAVVAIAEILPTQQTLRYAGVGNISGVILTDRTSRNLVSFNGIVGGSVRKFTEFSYDWSVRSVGTSQGDSLLVMHSDGLATHWSLDRYPGLINRHPALITAVLYRDFVRSRDDVTVLVAKLRQEEHV